MIAEYIFNLLRKMFYFIDRIVYSFIDDVYNLVIELASTSLFSTELINSFAERIYAFIGIFMLFKVTISLITHVLNPDDFTDKEKGFTSIIKRIILSLVMIVLVPYVFAEAYEFQKLILTENTLVTLIFGTPPDTTGQVEQLSGSAYVDTAGKKMQFILLSAFIYPNYEDITATGSNSDYDLSPCKELYVKDADGNFQFRAKKGGGNSTKSLYHYELNPACFGDYDADKDIYVGTFDSDTGNTEAALYKAFGSNKALYQTYAQGVAQQDYDLTFRKELIELETKGKYTMSYKPIISTVVGVVALYMLVLFCIDIAVRSIKLGFLQMIAPIPIISYVDPKSGKDGMFKKWTGMCVKTYLDLFIRLFALFFGIYIISLVGTFKTIHTGELLTDSIINVFLVIGVLIFVKKLPDILKDTLGFDGGTFKDFKLNPLKRFEDDAFLGKNITGALSGAYAGVRGGKVSGLINGLAYGAIEGKGWKGSRERAAEFNKALRNARLNGSRGISGLIGARREMAALRYGGDSPSDRFEREGKAAQAASEFHGANLDYAKGVRNHILEDLQNKQRSDLNASWRSYQDDIVNAESLLDAVRNGTTLTVNGATYTTQADAIRAAREYVASTKEAAVDGVLGTGDEDGYMKAEREKYNVRVSNNKDLAKQSGVKILNGAVNAATLKSIKNSSQAQKNQADMDSYRLQKSNQSSVNQANKTMAETERFKF